MRGSNPRHPCLLYTSTEEDGTKKKAALLKGFVEVTETTMSILAEVAEWPEDIDVERAKKAEERARKRLEAKSADIDIARAELAPVSYTHL